MLGYPYRHSSNAEKYYEYEGRVKKHMELAKRVANQSTFEGSRHGAVLARGSRVVNVSHNKNSFCSFGRRFRNSEIQHGHATLHAEIGCILGLDRSKTEGADVYVARVGKRGNLKMSKPCPMCEAALRHVGVKRVIFTVNNKIAGSYKL
jgi:tRNA(Arg) A34 adenosine deaminase TadA